MDQSLIFVFFIALFIVLAVVGAVAAARRRKNLTALAGAQGWQFDPEKDRAMEDRFPAFKCLRQGSARYAYNRLQGRLGERSFLGFDYHYETHSTDSKGRRQTHHHHFSAVILGSKMPLKPLLIRPEGFFDKIGEFFGFDDIDFESLEFSKRFHVSAPEKRWAYDVLHPRAMEFLLAQPEFTIEFATDCVMIFRGVTFEPAEFLTAGGVGAGVLDQFPPYLVEQQAGRRAETTG